MIDQFFGSGFVSLRLSVGVGLVVWRPSIQIDGLEQLNQFILPRFKIGVNLLLGTVFQQHLLYPVLPS